MKIWVDADACPNPIKEILFRSVKRANDIQLVLVANQYINIPPSAQIRMLKVSHGFDVADDRIAEELEAGDLVVTADIPLAAEVVDRGGFALNPRGTFYDRDNVGEHLARRNLMQELRDTGTVSGGPGALGRAEIQAFANQLDRFLTRNFQLK